MNGFIMIPRCFLENESICKDAYHIGVLVCVLSHVSFNDGGYILWEGKQTELKRGEMVTSIRKISNELKIPQTTVVRILDNFKKQNVIGTKSEHRKTLISIDPSALSKFIGGTRTERKRNESEERKDDKEKRSKREKEERKEIINNKNNNKEIYGVFENVKLTSEEFESFKAKFPISHKRYIDDLSHYIASKGDKYKSHYATLLTWNRDKSDDMVSFDTDEFFQAALKRSSEHIFKRAKAHENEGGSDATELGW